MNKRKDLDEIKVLNESYNLYKEQLEEEKKAAEKQALRESGQDYLYNQRMERNKKMKRQAFTNNTLFYTIKNYTKRLVLETANKLGITKKSLLLKEDLENYVDRLVTKILFEETGLPTTINQDGVEVLNQDHAAIAPISIEIAPDIKEGISTIIKVKMPNVVNKIAALEKELPTEEDLQNHIEQEKETEAQEIADEINADGDIEQENPEEDEKIQTIVDTVLEMIENGEITEEEGQEIIDGIENDNLDIANNKTISEETIEEVMDHLNAELTEGRITEEEYKLAVERLEQEIIDSEEDEEDENTEESVEGEEVITEDEEQEFIEPGSKQFIPGVEGNEDVSENPELTQEQEETNEQELSSEEEAELGEANDTINILENYPELEELISKLTPEEQEEALLKLQEMTPEEIDAFTAGLVNLPEEEQDEIISSFAEKIADEVSNIATDDAAELQEIEKNIANIKDPGSPATLDAMNEKIDQLQQTVEQLAQLQAENQGQVVQESKMFKEQKPETILNLFAEKEARKHRQLYESTEIPADSAIARGIITIIALESVSLVLENKFMDKKELKVLGY